MSKNSYAMPARILHVVGRMDRAGAETMLMNYYRALDRQRYQFDFLVFDADRGDYDEEIESLGGRVVRLTSGNWLTRSLAMYRLMRNGPWVAVHAHTNFSNMFPLLAAAAAQVPVRVSHAHVTGYMHGSPVKSVYQAVAPWVIRKASTHRLACGVAAARLLYRADEAVTLIPNAIATEGFMLDRDAQSIHLRHELGLAPDTLILLQVGRLDPVKNQLFTLEIVRELRARGRDCVVLMAGRGALESALRARIAECGLDAQVRLLGIRDDVPRLLNGADVFMLPSLFEGFPVVLVEAQAAGIPCVVSDRVSAEVDLGLGLLQFLAVPDGAALGDCHAAARAWADTLEQMDRVPIPARADRARVLQASGYSVANSTSRLTDLYDVGLPNQGKVGESWTA